MSGIVPVNGNSVLNTFNDFWSVINTQASNTIDVLNKLNKPKTTQAPAQIPSTVNSTPNMTRDDNIKNLLLYGGAAMLLVGAGLFIYRKI